MNQEKYEHLGAIMNQEGLEEIKSIFYTKIEDILKNKKGIKSKKRFRRIKDNIEKIDSQLGLETITELSRQELTDELNISKKELNESLSTLYHKLCYELDINIKKRTKEKHVRYGATLSNTVLIPGKSTFPSNYHRQI